MPIIHQIFHCPFFSILKIAYNNWQQLYLTASLEQLICDNDITI